MLKLTNIYKLIALFLLIGGSSLYAQKSFLYKERVLLGSVGIQEGDNPAFLQNIKDSLLFTAKTTAIFNKGNFVNYYQSNNSHGVEVETDSYNRMNDKIVVYGLASYLYEKRKESGSSSFLNPEQVPFDFIEKDINSKGDSKVESYNLAGAMSYRLSPKFDIGLKIDYQTVSFAKFKDMRNLNDILDLKANVGVAFALLQNNKIGLSYQYKRYIEGVRIMQEGDFSISHYALVNKGLFMGLMHLYGEDGILKINRKRPWAAISHNLGLQYQALGEKTDFFFSFEYDKEKGHFGKEGNSSIMYYRHNRNTYIGQLKVVQKGIFSHILEAKAKYEELKNKERLYNQTTTSGGSTTVSYYGENKIFDRKKIALAVNYNLLWGDVYLHAPWHFSFTYEYNNRESKSIYYPFIRKQNIDWHSVELGLTHLFRLNNTYFAISCASNFRFGSGGDLQDNNTGANGASSPDYLNDLLYIEKEYLTAKRFTPRISVRAERKIKQNISVFGQLNASFTKAFNTEVLKGDYKALSLSVGLTF